MDDFLKLPALDIQWNQSSFIAEVGDAVSGKIGPIVLEEGKTELKIEQPKEEVPYFVRTQWKSLASNGKSPEGELTFLLVPKKEGTLSIPSLPIVDQTGKPVARTNPIEVQIKPAQKETNQKEEVSPPAPPVGMALPIEAVIERGVLGTVILVLIGYLIYRWFRRKKKSKPTEPAYVPKELPKPEDILAHEALVVLEQQGWAQKGQYKRHYFGISEIMKQYLGSRYRFDAQESTTRELLMALNAQPLLDRQQYAEIEGLFSRLDPVKFTDAIPPSGEPSILIMQARSIIDATKKKIAPLGDTSAV